MIKQKLALWLSVHQALYEGVYRTFWACVLQNVSILVLPFVPSKNVSILDKNKVMQTSGTMPEFISISGKPRREPAASNRGHYGPPKTLNRGLNRTISKRKREPNSEEHLDRSFEISRMPWHPHALENYAQGIIGLHEEIEDFYQWMVPTSQEHYARLGVVHRVRTAVLKIFPACRVEIFGSFRTGLYLPTR